MADDPSKRGTPDNDLISLTQPHEVAYWTRALGVTEAQLRAAIAKVGRSVKAVKAHFGK